MYEYNLAFKKSNYVEYVNSVVRLVKLHVC